MGHTDQDLTDIEFAAYLHDIGKISRLHSVDPSAPRRRGINRTTTFLDHPTCGCAILSYVAGFENIAWAVRHQHEYYDGTGSPEGLKGEDIPLGSRIIAVANAYDKAVFRASSPTSIARDAGHRALLKGRGTRFDPKLTSLLLECVDRCSGQTDRDNEVELSAKQLKEGMTLSRDVKNAEGVLLLKKEVCLSSEHMERIRSLGEVDPLLARVFVKCSGQPRADGDGELSHEPSETEAGQSVRPADSPPVQPEQRRRVLIADDDTSICNALRRELSRAGWETTCAENGRDAQVLLEDEHFDLLLVDVAMPVMSGEELVAHVAQCWPALPCVVLTGAASPRQVVRLGKTPNVAKILAKPWDHDQLMTTIASAVRHESAERNAELA